MIEVVKNFLSSDLARFCMLMLEHECQIQDRVGNHASFTPLSSKVFDYKYQFFAPAWTEMIMAKKLNHMQQITKRQLYPVRSLARKYLKGDSMPEHTDTLFLEWSATIHLGGTKWNIYFDDKPYLLMPGDAIVYKGTVPHYRKEFKGRSCYQAMIHYSRKKEDLYSGKKYFKMYGKQSDI